MKDGVPNLSPMLFERFFPPRYDKEGLIEYMKHIASYWPRPGIKDEIERLRLIYRLAHHEEAPIFRQILFSANAIQ